MTPPLSSAPNRSGISLVSAACIVAASMIGAGVYTTSGFALADLGSPWLVLALWGLGGAIALCGAVSYGALAERFSESGGEYLYLSRALHPALGSVVGFVSLLAGFTGPIALAALTFEAYLPGVDEDGNLSLLPWRGAAAALLVIAATFMHATRVSAGARLQDFMVVIKLGMLAVFLLVAFLLSREPWQGLETAAVPEASRGWPVGAMAVSLMYISLSYSGFNAAIYITGEVREGGRTVRRALILGTVTVTLLYLLLNAVFVLAPPTHEAAGRKDIAAFAAVFVGGPAFGQLFRAVILLSLATSVSSAIMTGPRVYAKMAEDGVLPRWFRFRGEVPRRAILVQAGLALVVIHWATLKQLLSYLGMTLALSAALTVGSLLILHRRGEPVSTPLYPLPPLLFTVLTVGIAAVAGWQEPMQLVLAVGTMLIGLIAYGLQRWGTK